MAKVFKIPRNSVSPPFPFWRAPPFTPFHSFFSLSLFLPLSLSHSLSLSFSTSFSLRRFSSSHRRLRHHSSSLILLFIEQPPPPVPASPLSSLTLSFYYVESVLRRELFHPSPSPLPTVLFRGTPSLLRPPPLCFFSNYEWKRRRRSLLAPSSPSKTRSRSFSSRACFFFLSRRCFHFVEVDSVAFFPPRDGNPSPSLARLPDGKLHCFLPRLATFFHECSRWMDSFRRVLLATGFAPPRRVYVLFTRRCWSDYFSELVFLGIFRIYKHRKKM